MAYIVLVKPRFDASYWGLEHALPLLGKEVHSAERLPAVAGAVDWS